MSCVEFGKCAIQQCSNHYIHYNVPLRKMTVHGVFKTENDTDSSATFPLEIRVCLSCYKQAIDYGPMG